MTLTNTSLHVCFVNHAFESSVIILSEHQLFTCNVQSSFACEVLLYMYMSVLFSAHLVLVLFIRYSAQIILLQLISSQ